MTALTRILLVADPQMRVSPAFERAAVLARQAGATLTISLLDHHPLIDATGDLVNREVADLAKAQWLQQRRQWLDGQVATLSTQGVKAQGEVRWSPVLHTALVDRVYALKPDLVIKDLSPDSARARHWFAPADWKALRYCPAPLMLVRPGSPALPRRVVVSVDPSGDTAAKTPLNDAVWQAAQALGETAGAELHLTHVFPFSPPTENILRDLSRVYNEMREISAHKFRDFAQRHGINEAHRHLLAGDPAPALAEFAESQKADVLVLGSVYRTVFDRFFLGSTAEAVLTAAHCDLMVVKPPQFTEALERHLDIPALRAEEAGRQPNGG